MFDFEKIGPKDVLVVCEQNLPHGLQNNLKRPKKFLV